ncbi:MAG: YciI family protein [Anaerolineae bacterium]|nr:YciI family protein [Anaerolineae bacterium]
MKYMLLFYASEAAAQQAQAQGQEIAAAWYAFMQEAGASGALISTNGLLPTANATTVRIRNDKTLTTDGPFAETHEQLGGFAIFDCADLDDAIRWAEKIPHAKYGSVEIRPLWSEG